MVVSLAPTTHFANFNGVLCRRWAGFTRDGIEVCAWIARVMPMTLDPSALATFDQVLVDVTAVTTLEPSVERTSKPAFR